MFDKKQRFSPRNHYVAPILYTDHGKGNYHDSKMHNFSAGGLYFEPAIPPKPASNIFIRMVNYSPNGQGPEAYQSYLAKTVWCKESQTAAGARYGVGVEFLIRSQEIYEPEATEAKFSCGLCGCLIAVDDIILYDDYVFLCPGCKKHLSMLPEGNVKDSIDRFLTGNVI